MKCFVLYIPPCFLLPFLDPSILCCSSRFFPGAFKATATTCGPLVRPVAGVSLPATSPLLSGSSASVPWSPSGVSRPSFGPPSSSLFQLPPSPAAMSHSGLNMPVATAQFAPLYLGTGMAQPASLGGIPSMGCNINPPFLGMGMVQPSFAGGNPPIGLPHLAGGAVASQPQLLSGSGLDETTHKNNNPFLL